MTYTKALLNMLDKIEKRNWNKYKNENKKEKIKIEFDIKKINEGKKISI
jgi:hypothetical protein